MQPQGRLPADYGYLASARRVRGGRCEKLERHSFATKTQTGKDAFVYVKHEEAASAEARKQMIELLVIRQGLAPDQDKISCQQRQHAVMMRCQVR